ncbi:MAG: Hsp20/alpha crystallin family protein [bacterium]
MFKIKNDEIIDDDYDSEIELPRGSKNNFLKKNKEQENWLGEDYEGQLSVDVYQTEKDIVIKSTIAGIRPEDIEITINNDMVTIRGSRSQEMEIDKNDYLFQECYWGGFSRSIILPQPVKADKVSSTLENGILTIRLPMAPQVKKVDVKVRSLKKIKKEKVSNIRGARERKKVYDN